MKKAGCTRSPCAWLPRRKRRCRRRRKPRPTKAHRAKCCASLRRSSGPAWRTTGRGRTPPTPSSTRILRWIGRARGNWRAPSARRPVGVASRMRTLVAYAALGRDVAFASIDGVLQLLALLILNDQRAAVRTDQLHLDLAEFAVAGFIGRRIAQAVLVTQAGRQDRKST